MQHPPFDACALMPALTSGVNIKPGAINVTEMLQGARYPLTEENAAAVPAPAPAGGSSNPRLSAASLDDDPASAAADGEANPPTASLPKLNDGQVSTTA